jgi:hypothetical protein
VGGGGYSQNCLFKDSRRPQPNTFPSFCPFNQKIGFRKPSRRRPSKPPSLTTVEAVTDDRRSRRNQGTVFADPNLVGLFADPNLFADPVFFCLFRSVPIIDLIKCSSVYINCFPCWIRDYKIHAMYISVCNIWFLNKLDSLHSFPRFECMEDLSFISKKWFECMEDLASFQTSFSNLD